jgi:uncharacterized protein (DUF2147 family)
MQSLFAITLCLLASATFAQTTPVGLWHSIDDTTNQPKAEIRITEDNGVLTGRVVRSLQPALDKPNATCELCTDDRKGKPMAGLEIIRGAKANSDNHAWDSGTILDPNNGKTYTLALKPTDKGTKLQVRGYIGPFFRTQIWTRAQ